LLVVGGLDELVDQGGGGDVADPPAGFGGGGAQADEQADKQGRGVADGVRELIAPGETVMVLLDARHAKDHVLAELRAYGELVTPGSYIVAADGIMERLVGAPRTEPDWAWNNPVAAIEEFLRGDERFVAEEPPFAFNEGLVRERVTYWPRGYLRRVR